MEAKKRGGGNSNGNVSGNGNHNGQRNASYITVTTEATTYRQRPPTRLQQQIKKTVQERTGTAKGILRGTGNGRKP